MIEKIERLIQEILEMAAQKDASPQAIQLLGLDAKQALWDEFSDMQRAVNIIDGIVPYRAEGLVWTIGWFNPSATPTPVVSTGRGTTIATGEPTARPSVEAAVRPSVVRSNRIRRVLTLAQEAIDSERNAITTDEIATTLQNEGDATARRSLQTAVGNILNRTGHWKRVRTGEYEYQEEREV